MVDKVASTTKNLGAYRGVVVMRDHNRRSWKKRYILNVWGHGSMDLSADHEPS